MKARAGLIGSIAIAPSMPAIAQTIPPASIADQEIGWAKVYNFTGATEPLKVDHGVYSPAQRSTAMELANWMQASYIPVGGLGDVVLAFSERLGPYNQNTAAMPHSYGVYGSIYDELKHGANRKLELHTSGHTTWSVMVNGSFG